MTKTYRKLDEKELRTLHKNLNGFFNHEEYNKHTRLIKVVDSFFSGVCTILISVHSEYNDSTYDNKVNSVSVYDSDDMEIPLSREKRVEFNKVLDNMEVVPYETNEFLEDIVLYVNKQIPDIYVEEK